MVNKAILLGRLGIDPELNYTASGKGVCKFRIATSERWTDDKGEKHETTTWHNIVVWGKPAEHCKEYLRKGSLVFIEGRIDNRTYDDKDGNKRYVSEINASTVKFLDKREAGEQAEPQNTRKEATDDDLPF